MSELASAHIIISGVVQGVGFRYTAIRKATQHRLNGFVRNLHSGDVEVVVEGEKGLITDFVRELRVGPSYAHITNVAVEWGEYTGNYEDFRVRF
jgi:acylphosphatase